MDAGGDVPHGFDEFFATVDVVVMGRRTYDVVRKLGYPEPHGKMPTIVVSHRPLDPPVQSTVVEQMSGEPPEIVKQLTARGFQHAYIDGGITIQRFLAAGCIHRMIITRLPILIGTGIPLFGPVPRDITLRHIATRTYPAGLVQSEYEILIRESSG